MSTNESVTELLEFLASPRPDLRRVATNGVLSLSGTEEGRLLLNNATVIQLLGRLAGDIEVIAEDALRSLLNLSGSVEHKLTMVKMNMVGRTMENLKTEDYSRKLKRLNMMLLSNITQEESGAASLLQVDTPLFGLNVCRVLHWFIMDASTPPLMKRDGGVSVLDGAGDEGMPELVDGEEEPEKTLTVEGDEENDIFGYASHVLTNISQIPEGRDLMLDPAKNIFPRILPQLNSVSSTRRLGVAGSIRNFCFSPDCHSRLISSGVPRLILWPLVGPEDLSVEDKELISPELQRLGKHKRREECPGVRRLLVEAMLLFCCSRAGRDALRDLGAYPIIRDLHKAVEAQPEVAPDDEMMFETIVQLVDFLHREEPLTAEEEKRIEQEKERKRNEAEEKLTTAPSVADSAVDEAFEAANELEEDPFDVE